LSPPSATPPTASFALPSIPSLSLQLLNATSPFLHPCPPSYLFSPLSLATYPRRAMTLARSPTTPGQAFRPQANKENLPKKSQNPQLTVPRKPTATLIMRNSCPHSFSNYLRRNIPRSLHLSAPHPVPRISSSMPKALVATVAV
jgi:hypothetical protein